MPYETYLQKTAPTWLRGANGQAWLGGIGATKDFYVDQVRQAVLSSFPQYAPADALGVLGDEIGLDQGPSESNADYAARLVAAWIYWPLAGTPIGLLCALHFAGFDSGVLVQQNGIAYQLTLPLTVGIDPKPNLVRTSLSQLAVPLTSSVTPPTASSAGRSIPAGDSWWTFDSNTDFCSRFAILFPGLVPSAFITYGTATFTNSASAPVVWNNVFPDTTYHMKACAPNATYGIAGALTAWMDGTAKTTTGCVVNTSGTFTGTVDVYAWQAGANPFADIHAADLVRLQNAIKKWKPAKATCVGVYVLVQGKFLEWPVGTMDQLLDTPSEVISISGSF